MAIAARDDRIMEVWMRVTDPKRISKLMLIQEISQREMARKIGWKSHSYLTRILRGEIRSVTPDVAARIACVLGVGVDDLFLPKASTQTARNAPRRGAA